MAYVRRYTPHTGRPPIPVEKRRVQRTVRVSPVAFDVAYRYAQARGLTTNVVLQRTLEYIFTHPEIIEMTTPCYSPSRRSSTLSRMLGG